MSLQKTRPMDTLQRIISSFKHFEKKLDKLQDDVNFHGHTLTELRVMVANLSGGIPNPDGKQQERKTLNKTTTIQHEEFKNGDAPSKNKRKNNIQPILSKGQTKSFQEPKYNRKPGFDTTPYNVKKLPSSPKQSGVATKRSQRHRKATTLRSQKEIGKKRSKMPKDKLISVIYNGASQQRADNPLKE